MAASRGDEDTVRPYRVLVSMLCDKRHEDFVKTLLNLIVMAKQAKRTFNLNFPIPSIENFFDGFTLLHYAVYHGSELGITCLLDQGAIVNLKKKGSEVGYYGLSPLHIAAIVGDVSIANLLITRDAEINAIQPFLSGYQYKRTPLYWAIKCGRQAMVDFLIAQGADPTIYDEKSILGLTQRRMPSRVDSFRVYNDLLLYKRSMHHNQVSVEWLIKLSVVMPHIFPNELPSLQILCLWVLLKNPSHMTEEANTLIGGSRSLGCHSGMIHSDVIKCYGIFASLSTRHEPSHFSESVYTMIDGIRSVFKRS